MILLGIGLRVLVTVVWNYRKLESVSIRQSHLPDPCARARQEPDFKFVGLDRAAAFIYSLLVLLGILP